MVRPQHSRVRGLAPAMLFARAPWLRGETGNCGTTIGGWRSEFIDGQVWWKYKGSPFGPVVWTEIVAAPVWLPPETTPPRDLLDRNPHRRSTSEKPFVVDVHETGPSYASAYGLVAAYHHTFRETGDGALRVARALREKFAAFDRLATSGETQVLPERLVACAKA